MAKIKFNIKNTQLADALKSKKGTTATEQAPLKPKKSVAATEKTESKKPLTRIKEDPSLASGEKVIEKPMTPKTEKEIESPVKRKARIMKEAPSDEPQHLSSVEEPFTTLAKKEDQTIEPEIVISEPKEPLKTAQVEAKTEAPVRETTLPPAPPKAKELKPALKKKEDSRFDSRDRQGLRDIDNEAWRKRRQHKPLKKNLY